MTPAAERAIPLPAMPAPPAQATLKAGRGACPEAAPRAAWAFTLLELLVVVLLLGVLAAVLVPTVAWAKARSRTSACLANLKHLGSAFALYDSDSDGRLPPAAWRVRYGEEMSWDDWLDWHLGGNLTTADKWAAVRPPGQPVREFTCPSPPSAAPPAAPAPAQRRSYAMPRHVFDRQTAPWPPRVRSQTGVGVVWDFQDGLTPDANTRATWEIGERFRFNGLPHTRPVRRQSAVLTALVRQPETTIALAEVSRPSLAGGLERAAVTSPAEQSSPPGPAAQARAPALPHGPRAHYLMVDGHAEARLPAKTIRPGAPLDAQTGMWTISTRD